MPTLFKSWSNGFSSEGGKRGSFAAKAKGHERELSF